MLNQDATPPPSNGLTMGPPSSSAVRAKRFHDAVDPVTRQAEDRIDAPVDEALDDDVGGCA